MGCRCLHKVGIVSPTAIGPTRLIAALKLIADASASDDSFNLLVNIQ
jgi:hypothetical protein